MRFLASPHHNTRPAGTTIDLVILHAISLPPGKFDTQHIEAFFTGRLDCSLHPAFSTLRDIRVSAHFLVDRAGRLTQFVPLARRAWHAGRSVWEDRPDCNDYSVGIEIIGDEEHPFTPAQYRETARLCRLLMQEFPAIGRQRIVGHSDVAPGRKWDPGRQWDWARFHRSLSRIRRLDAGPIR